MLRIYLLFIGKQNEMTAIEVHNRNCSSASFHGVKLESDPSGLVKFRLQKIAIDYQAGCQIWNYDDDDKI
jgi:hypothetical protein